MTPTHISKSIFNKVFLKLIPKIKIIKASNKLINLLTFLIFISQQIIKLSDYFHTIFISTLKAIIYQELFNKKSKKYSLLYYFS